MGDQRSGSAMYTQGDMTHGGTVITGSHDTKDGFYNAVSGKWENRRDSETSIRTGAGYKVDQIQGGQSHTAAYGGSTQATSNNGAHSNGNFVKYVHDQIK